MEKKKQMAADERKNGRGWRGTNKVSDIPPLATDSGYGLARCQAVGVGVVVDVGVMDKREVRFNHK